MNTAESGSKGPLPAGALPAFTVPYLGSALLRRCRFFAAPAGSAPASSSSPSPSPSALGAESSPPCTALLALLEALLRFLAGCLASGFAASAARQVACHRHGQPRQKHTLPGSWLGTVRMLLCCREGRRGQDPGSCRVGARKQGSRSALQHWPTVAASQSASTPAKQDAPVQDKAWMRVVHGVCSCRAYWPCTTLSQGSGGANLPQPCSHAQRAARRSGGPRRCHPRCSPPGLRVACLQPAHCPASAPAGPSDRHHVATVVGNCGCTVGVDACSSFGWDWNCLDVAVTESEMQTGNAAGWALQATFNSTRSMQQTHTHHGHTTHHPSKQPAASPGL